MKMPLVQHYNPNNPVGTDIEILDLKRSSGYASGVACLAKLNGLQPVWLTIDWFLPQEEKRPTKHAPDARKSAPKIVKSKSKGSVKPARG